MSCKLFDVRFVAVLAAILYFLLPSQGDAATCTPSGWSTPTDCTPIRVGDWEFTSQEVPWGKSVPGKFKSYDDFVHALTEVFTSAGFCYVTPTAVYPTGAEWSFGVQYRQDYDVAADFGLWNGTSCYANPAYFGTLGLRKLGCPTGRTLAWNSGGYTCACTTNQCVVQRAKVSGCLSKGNPCDLLVGNKLEEETDYRGTGAYPLTFSRTYNSGTLNDTYYWYFTSWYPMGVGWSATYLQRLRYNDNGTHKGVYAFRPDGSMLIFDETPAGFAYTGELQDRLEWTVDAFSVRSGWRYTTANDEVELYDLNGRLLSIRNRGGNVHTLTYGASGYLASVTDSFGHALLFTWDTQVQRRLTQIQDPTGNTISFSYDTYSNLIAVTYPDAKQRQYLYELTGTGRTSLLTGLKDESTGRYATWGYNSNNQVTSSEHAGGVDDYSFTYNGDGSRVVVDPLGTSRSYTTSVIANQRRYTGASSLCAGCGEFADVDYDSYGNVSARTDFNGNETHFGYDTARTLEISRTEAYGTAKARTITTAWHSTYRLPTTVTETGRTTSFTHDSAGNVLTRTVTDTTIVPNTSRTWTYTYNSFGQVLTGDGPRTDVSDVTTYTYYTCTTGYQCGQVNTITNALGHVTTYNTYNAHGQPLTITDPNGVVTTLTYDLRQRATSRTVGSEQTSFEYWPTGLLKKATLPDGSFIAYTYDAAHRLTGINDAEGNRIAYVLDAMGNRTKEEAFDPSNTLTQTRSRVFNSLNQLWKDIGAAGTAAVTTSFGYDNNGNQTGINAPLSRNTTQAYDELNRLTQVTDPSTGLTQYGYNALDQLISVTDPRSKVTSYTYNALGDLTQQVSPDTGTTSHTYDSAGNLKTRTDARSKTGTYSYDALNRVSQLSYPDQTITYTYDQGTNAAGRLSSLTDASGSTAWLYDAQGRVTSRQQSMGSVSKTVGYGYNSFGQLQGLTLPSGTAIGYGYQNGKVTSVTLNGSTVLLNNVLYQPFGPTLGWTWGNATQAVREYDTDGKVTDIDSAGLKTYAYDDAFRITGITDADNAALSQTYSYDPLDRLTGATGTGLNQSWTYDANGNRLTEGGAQPSTYAIATASNRISSISGSLTRSYGYDAAGNTTGDGTATYTYDDAGRMVSATKAGVTTDYKLNALGQRVRKTISAAHTYFVYDEAGHLLGEYDNAGSAIQETIWLGDTPVATLRPNGSGGVNVFYVHTDHLNTPRRITRPSDDAIVWRWDSDPFGVTGPNQNPSGLGAFAYNLRFPGQYADSETGLNYNYYRDYDPAIGRYVQGDPIGLDGGLNPYEYVDGNPLELIDPFGLQAVPVPVPRPVPIPTPSPGNPPTAGPGKSSTGARISSAADEVGVDRSEMGRPMGRGRQYCVIACNGVEIAGPGQGKGVSTNSCCPEVIYGLGFGSDAADAWNNAWDAATLNTPRGCSKRHCRGKAGACKNWIGGKR